MNLKFAATLAAAALGSMVSIAGADVITSASIPVSTDDFGYLSSATNSFPLRVDLGGLGETINGATFTAGSTSGAGGLNAAGTGNVSYALTGGNQLFTNFSAGATSTNSNGAGSTNGAAINSLLSNFYYGGTNHTETLTITGLTPGTTATLTLLQSAFGAGAKSGREESVTGQSDVGTGETMNVTTTYDNGSTPGTPVNSYEENNGQFSTLTYSALVGTSGSISLTTVALDTNGDTNHFYGFTVAQTPEPASLGLLGLGTLGLLARRRRLA